MSTAKATAKTRTIEVTEVTLTMSVDAAFALHALTSRAEELHSDHPLHNGSREVYLALDELLRGGDNHPRLEKLYASIDLSESSHW